MYVRSALPGAGTTDGKTYYLAVEIFTKCVLLIDFGL